MECKSTSKLEIKPKTRKLLATPPASSKPNWSYPLHEMPRACLRALITIIDGMVVNVKPAGTMNANSTTPTDKPNAKKEAAIVGPPVCASAAKD
jgi:hypothetical protein